MSLCFEANKPASILRFDRDRIGGNTGNGKGRSSEKGKQRGLHGFGSGIVGEERRRVYANLRWIRSDLDGPLARTWSGVESPEGGAHETNVALDFKVLIPERLGEAETDLDGVSLDQLGPVEVRSSEGIGEFSGSQIRVKKGLHVGACRVSTRVRL